MKKWGLGIEHEMRIRFKNSISDLPKIIIDKLFPNINSEYIFIDSNTLLFYFKIYETIIMKDFLKYIETDEEKKYYNKISLKNELFKLAKNKIPFPLENNNFFDIELLDYYLFIYTLYNAPLLFFSYNFNAELIMSFKDLINYNKIINLMNNEKDTNIVKDFINESLRTLYNDECEKTILNYLQKSFINKNIEDFVFLYINNKDIQIYFKYYENNIQHDKFDTNIFLKQLEIFLDKTRNIFTKTINLKNNSTFYKNLYILYSNNIPHIDRTYSTKAIEFKTIIYENLSYEKNLNDLIELEQTFFYTVNNIPIIKDLTDEFGELIYHNIGSIQNTISIFDIININYESINEDYTGSYHIWITAPHDLETSNKKFINIHTILANKLQLLEPILAAHYSSPSYNGLNNNESKSSLRQFLNGYSNYGTTDISLLNGTKKHDISHYYLSEEDILNNKPISIYTTNKNAQNQRYIYDNKGKNIINYSKLMTRNITNNIFKLYDKGNEESTNLNIKNYFSQVFEKTKIRPKTETPWVKYLKLGADIRTRNFNDYFYPLDKDWERFLIIKKNKLVEIYYNKKINRFSYERIYDKNIYHNNLLNRIGIEFRIFDHFPTNYLNQILCLLVPIVLDSTETTKTIKNIKNTYISKQFWHNEMFNVITKGYEYTLGERYINILEKEFNIKIKHKKLLNTENILSILYDGLNKKYKSKRESSLYNQMKFTSKIIFTNFNKIAWREIINTYFKKHPDSLRKILQLNKNNNILEVLGEKFNFDLIKIKNYVKDYSSK